MATVTSNASCNPSSISVSGKNNGNGTISWSLPTVPAGGIISSCKLTGTCTVSDASNKPATVTVNGTSVSSGVAFTINLGTGNTTSSVAVAATGPHRNTNSTITFSNLVYTVTYAIYHTVTFVDWDGTVLKTEQVEEGSSATAPDNPTRDEYVFTGWNIDFNNVINDLTVTAQYAEIQYFTVTFKDWDGTVLKTQTVEEGASATAPNNPARDGYIFTGWDVSFSNVTSDLTVTAQYEEDTSSVVIPIQSIELNTIDTKLSIGMKKDIKAVLNPTNANEKCIWSVNNENILLSVNDRVPENTLLLYGKELQPTLKHCEVIQTENSFSLTSYTASDAAVTYNLDGLDPNETYTLTMNDTVNIAVEIYHGETYTSGNTATVYNLTGYSSYTIVFYNGNGTSENWSVTNISLKDSNGSENRPVYDGRTATIEALSEGNAVLTCSNQNKDVIATCNIEVLSYIEDKDLGCRRGLFSWIYDDLLECNALARAANVLNLTEVYQLIENITTFTQTQFDELSDAIYNLKCATKHNVDLVYLDGAAEWYADPAPAKACIDKIVEFNASNKNNIIIDKIMLDIEPWSAGITGWYPVYQTTMLEVYNYCKSKNLELLLCVPFWLDNGIDPTIVTDFHKIVIDLCDAYLCMNYNKNAYLTAMDVEMEYIKEKDKYIYSAAECQPVNDQWGVTEDLTYYNDGLDVLYSHWRNLYNKYAYDKLGFAIHDFNNAIKQWTNEVDITETNIQSVSFDKESDTVEIPFDAASINYKLNYTWEPLNANKDFNITTNDTNSIASYNEMTDEITFTGDGIITVTITSNQNSSISDSITIIVTREKEPEISNENLFPSFIDGGWNCAAPAEFEMIPRGDFNADFYSTSAYYEYSVDISQFKGKTIKVLVDDIRLVSMRICRNSSTAIGSIISSTNFESYCTIPDDDSSYSIQIIPTSQGTLNCNITNAQLYILGEETSIRAYTVEFGGYDYTPGDTDAALKVEGVLEGEDATPPENVPTREGYTFIGWSGPYTNVTSDLVLVAQYEETNIKTLVAKYTTNTAGVVPTFNDGYTYELTETENNGVYTVEITSDSDFTSCSFNGKTNLLTVEYLKITNVVTSMYQMFYNCNKLTSINGMSDWDTSNVTTMRSMFYNCQSLISLDVSNFNTSNVTDMYYMFHYCRYVTSLDVSNFKTSKVTNMGYMFQYCNNLTTLDVSNWDTSNVTDMRYMFKNCISLTTLDLSNFNTSNVTNMMCMFQYCESLTELDVSNFNTANVTDMYGMFYDCTNLTSLDISNFNTTNVTDVNNMFNSCTNLASISMNNSDYNSVNNIISVLPTRTTDSMGTLNVAGVDDISQVDTTTAQSKFWNVVEESLTEPVDGYIAKNLVSHGDWSYTFNVDWDTQYLDIEVLSYEYGLFGTSYYYDISNNSYDASYSHESLDGFIIHGVEVESGRNDIDIIRYSKVDGVCIITSNGTQIIPGNVFANDNKMTIKADIPTEWLREGDGVMTFNIKITDITPSEEPEEDIIEWTGIGTVATGLNSGIKHSNYKINLDWDNEYFDIILQNYTYTGNGDAGTNVCSIRINNNTYDYYFFEGNIALEQGSETIYEWTPNVIPHTLRFAKDGIYCLYGEENAKIGETEYNNDDAIYILEDDQYNTDFNIDFDLVVSERPNEEPEEDVIEWTGIGTVATGLRAHDVEHNNYKINIDWDTQCFDIIVTEDFNHLFDEAFTKINIASLDKIIIGNNIYEPTLFVNNNIDITIYGPTDETSNYVIERNYPYTIRFAKEGIYVLYGSTSHLIMERDYDLDTIYFNEDGRDNDPMANVENGDYDVAFDLVVNERPNNNELVQGDINEDGTFNDESTTVVRTKYIDISDKKSIQVTVLTDNVYISACYLYNANKELVKVIEIPADKKRKFGVNLQELIAQIIEDEGGDQ